MTDAQPGKKNTCRPEADSAELQTAQRHPEQTNKAKDADRVGDWLDTMKLKEPIHKETQRPCRGHKELSDFSPIGL